MAYPGSVPEPYFCNIMLQKEKSHREGIPPMFHQIIKTRQKGANWTIPSNLCHKKPGLWAWKGSVDDGTCLLCAGAAKGKTPVKKGLLTISAPLNLKQLLTVGTFTLSIIWIFLLLCETKEQLKYIHHKLLPPLWFCPLMARWQALEILEDKSTVQTLIVSRICG